MPRVAARSREALSETRRDQILEAAVHLWLSRGFHATPVEAIAREAGLGKGTLYLYFPTKEAILQAAVERWSLLPDLEALAHTLDDVPPERAIPLVVSRLWGRLRERAPLVALLFREISLRPEDARGFLERVLLPANRLFAAWLDRHVERGALRPLDTFVAARGLVGMLVMFLLTQEVFGGAELRPISDAAIVETVSGLFLRGALPAGRR